MVTLYLYILNIFWKIKISSRQIANSYATSLDKSPQSIYNQFFGSYFESYLSILGCRMVNSSIKGRAEEIIYNIKWVKETGEANFILHIDLL